MDAKTYLIELKGAAYRGDAAAQFELGMHFQYSAPAEALFWFSRAAKLGNLDAHDAIFSMYDWFGLDVSDRSEYPHLGLRPADDAAEVLSLRRLFAVHGCSHAQVDLGDMYAHGIGVEKDIAEAERLYRLAADQGDEDGIQRLADSKERGFYGDGGVFPGKLLFLDTETTGTDLDDDRLIQLAWKISGPTEVNEALFQPPVEISLGAMSIHHITPRNLEGLPTFSGSETRIKLLGQLEDRVVVAHNARFDITMLGHEGVAVRDYIDTLRVAKHVLPDLESYKLQYLRYYFGFYQDFGEAHSAGADVLVLEAVFGKLVEMVDKTYSVSPEDVISEMIELTHQPVLLSCFPFGKHKGETFEWVSAVDSGYLEWLLFQKAHDGSDDEDLVYTLNYWLDKRSQNGLE